MTAQTDLEHLEIREVPFEHADGVMLYSAQRAETAAQYGPEAARPIDPVSGSEVAAFVVAYVDGMPAGCGALRPRSDDEFEVKRMYVTPAHRGTGVSVAVMRSLEDIAREKGAARLVLETGDRLAAAIRFYEREGFTRIENFGPFVGIETSVCFGKELS